MTRLAAKLTSKGQVTLPIALRHALNLRAGDDIVFVQIAKGEFNVRGREIGLDDLRGIVRNGPVMTDGTVRNWIDEARGARVIDQVSKRRSK